MECLVRGAGAANRERASGHLEPGSVQPRKRELIKAEDHRGNEGAHLRKGAE